MSLRPLRVFQLNVARSNWRMHGLLNSLSDFDIILFQEPWYGRIGVARSSNDPHGQDIKGTVNNPAWEAFMPEPDLDGGAPRVATFVRKGIFNLAARPRPDILHSRDTQATSFQYGALSFHIINIYNAGAGTNAQTVELLHNSELDPSIPTAIAGDFNLHHPDWALNQVPIISATAQSLVDWMTENAFFIQNDNSQCTRRGRTGQADTIIDLTLFNFPAEEKRVFSNWDCHEDLAAGSDHNAITWTVTVPDDEMAPEDEADPNPGFRIDPARRKEWCQALRDAIARQPPPRTYKEAEDVENGAMAILAALGNATAEVMPCRSRRILRRAPW
jgi:hypothetical protein